MRDIPSLKEPVKTATNNLPDELNGGLLEALPTAIYTCDLQGRITFYNRAAATLWGREPVIGKDLWCGSWKIYRPSGGVMPLEECLMAVTVREQRPVVDGEVVIERPDGTRINVLPHPQPLFDASGTMIGAINLLIDITEKKKRELALKESESKHRALSQLLEKKIEARTATLRKSEERYHKMIEEVQDYAILLLDTDGYIINWNKGAEKIKGYSEKEIIGQNFRIFYREKDRLSKLPEKLIHEAYTTGRAMHEGWRLRKDGSLFWGSIVITALHDEAQNIIGFSKVTRDLTAKKLADDKLKSYAANIELRNKQLEEYAYIASHDLQEPLRKIQIFAELLENNIDDPAAVKRNLEKINKSARRMTSLIKDVLRYSQLSSAQELFEDTDLDQVLHNVIGDYDLLIAQKNVQIISERLPVISGIPVQLNQLFSNLLSNAIKFNHENPVIEIYQQKPTAGELNNARLNSSGNYIKIIFKDNGAGFDLQYREQVFKMFKRLSNVAGTGIGLALCKKIVENHSGHIEVFSEPGKGTAFFIILPTEQVQAGDEHINE